MADDYKSPIDLEAIKRGTVINRNCFGDQVMPGIIRASEAQRTALAVKQQLYGATFRVTPVAANRDGARCEVTGNPPGTDVWPEGHPCCCSACRASP